MKFSFTKYLLIFIFFIGNAYSEITFLQFKEFYCRFNQCSDFNDQFKNYSWGNSDNNSTYSRDYGSNSSHGLSNEKYQSPVDNDELYEIYVSLINNCTQGKDEMACEYLNYIKEQLSL